MGLFGDDTGQDGRLDELERQVRRLVEEVQQLSIDLGVTRTELLRARMDLRGVVKVADIDPSIVALNDLASTSRAALDDAKDSNDKSWGSFQKALQSAVDDLRRAVDAAWVQQAEPS